MLISIVVPMYNVENYITGCLKSIINQTYKNIELIVVDDGATDKSYDICKCYLEENAKINYQIIRQENGGVSKARNNGIDKAKGEYIFLLDADDTITEDFISKLQKRAEETDSDMIFGGWDSVAEDGKILSRYNDTFIYLNDVISGIDACIAKIKKEMWICQGTALYRKSIIDQNNIRFREGCAYGEDLEFTNKALFKSRTVSGVEMNGLKCLERAGSALRSGFNNKFFDALESNRRLYEYVKESESFDKKEELLLLIDNDYNNGVLDIYSRMLACYSLDKTKDIIKSYNAYVIDLKENFLIKTIDSKWKLKYNLLRNNLTLGLSLIKSLEITKKIIR